MSKSICEASSRRECSWKKNRLNRKCDVDAMLTLMMTNNIIQMVFHTKTHTGHGTLALQPLASTIYAQPCCCYVRELCEIFRPHRRHHPRHLHHAITLHFLSLILISTFLPSLVFFSPPQMWKNSLAA